MIDALIKPVTKWSTVLEPSAGYGAIAIQLATDPYNCIVDVCELNTKYYAVLEQQQKERNSYRNLYRNLYKGDFLTLSKFPHEQYDFVIGVPPYKDSVDCLHIRKMYEVVRSGGYVRAFTLPTWTTGNFTIHQQFRAWLNTVNYELVWWEDESYANCPKALLIIRK